MIPSALSDREIGGLQDSSEAFCGPRFRCASYTAVLPLGPPELQRNLSKAAPGAQESVVSPVPGMQLIA